MPEATEQDTTAAASPDSAPLPEKWPPRPDYPQPQPKPPKPARKAAARRSIRVVASGNPARPGARVAPPELLAETEADLARKNKIAALITELLADQRQRNLRNAVRLAQQAAAGHGPLVEHFAELGRRYVEALSPPPKPRLTLVKGQQARDDETGRGGAA